MSYLSIDRSGDELEMKFIAYCEVPVEVGNAFEKDPEAQAKLVKYIEQLKPEAVYFGASRRFIVLVVNAENSLELSKMALPIWRLLKTYPKVEAVNTMDDFGAFMSDLGELVKDL
jgi:hypothetical protein